MLEQKRLWGEGKTIERRVSLPRIVSAEGFTPNRCRQEWRHGTQECVRHVLLSPQVVRLVTQPLTDVTTEECRIPAVVKLVTGWC